MQRCELTACQRIFGRSAVWAHQEMNSRITLRTMKRDRRPKICLWRGSLSSQTRWCWRSVHSQLHRKFMLNNVTLHQKYGEKRLTLKSCVWVDTLWHRISFSFKCREHNRLIGFMKRKLRLKMDLEQDQERWAIRKRWEAKTWVLLQTQASKAKVHYIN